MNQNAAPVSKAPSDSVEELLRGLRDLCNADQKQVHYHLLEDVVPANCEHEYAITNPEDPKEILGYFMPYDVYLRESKSVQDWLADVTRRNQHELHTCRIRPIRSDWLHAACNQRK